MDLLIASENEQHEYHLRLLLENKVKVIQDFPVPNSLRKLREFLGVINFYRRFIPHCADILQPLTDMLSCKSKDKAISLTECELASFQRAKSTLAEATMLVHPAVDTNTCVHCRLRTYFSY